MSELDEFYVHTISVQTLIGSGAYGDVFADPVTLSPDTDTGVFVDDKRRLVRSASGEETVSETTLFGRPALAAVIVAESLVTLPSGRVATVITTSALDSGAMDLPDHFEANLT
jgi:hypothetical protein